jgi:hypothetical protein
MRSVCNGTIRGGKCCEVDPAQEGTPLLLLLKVKREANQIMRSPFKS